MYLTHTSRQVEGTNYTVRISVQCKKENFLSDCRVVYHKHYISDSTMLTHGLFCNKSPALCPFSIHANIFPPLSLNVSKRPFPSSIIIPCQIPQHLSFPCLCPFPRSLPYFPSLLTLFLHSSMSIALPSSYSHPSPSPSPPPPPVR